MSATFINIVKERIIKSKSKVLIAGPYVGEFGWELMEWQGYVRKLKNFYDKIIVVSYKNREYLYEDCIFLAHNFNLIKSKFAYGYIADDDRDKIIGDIVKKYSLINYDVLTPQNLNRLLIFFIGKQIHKKFYEPIRKNKRYNIVFHFRDFKRYDDDNKNIDSQVSAALVDHFLNKNEKVAVIGHPKMSYCPPCADDCRSENLLNDISIISNSDIVVGGSSAPMHLACLCGKPIVTWIGGGTDIERYISYWNPFKVPVYIVSDKTFQPNFKDIADKIQFALNQIRK